MESISEARAVSEVFKLFAALFDGPPPMPAASKVIDAILPELRKAVGLGEREIVLRPECFAEEYEGLFLVPGGERRLSPYSTNYTREPEEARGTLIPELLILAETLGVPWQKESFVPGRAYPVMPDHLSVEFSLLSAVSLVDLDADIAGKPSLEGNSMLTEEVALALEGMSNVMLARDGPAEEPGYYEVVMVALRYMRTYLEIGLPCRSSRGHYVGRRFDRERTR